MTDKPTRGGSRPGAGRKLGSGKGRSGKSSSVYLLPERWQKLDAIRGRVSRSAWISEKIENEKL